MATYNGTASGADLDKITGLQSNASEIDSYSNTFDSSFSEIHKKFRKHINGEISLKYIVSGDSTRSNYYNSRYFMPDYYKAILSQLNISYYNNSSGGQTANDWAKNIDYTTVQQAIDNIDGTGSSTIVEISLGINDIRFPYTVQEIKDNILLGINTILASKPDTTFLLVSPTNTERLNDDDPDDVALQGLYADLATETGYAFINSNPCMDPIHSDTYFWHDSTHPNEQGGRRLINYIFNASMPIEVSNLITISNYTYIPPNVDNIATEVVVGRYSNTTGEIEDAYTTARRMLPIPVHEGLTLTFEHGGTVYNGMLMDINNELVERIDFPLTIDGKRALIVPAGARWLRLTLTYSDGANYDTLNDVPEVRYVVPTEQNRLLEEINVGLTLNQSKDLSLIPPYTQSAFLKRATESKFYDKLGSTGTSGQVLTANGDGTCQWKDQTVV